MPDGFESAYPLTPKVNPQDIRARANSSSKKKPSVTFLAGGEAVEIPDKSEVGADKPLYRNDKSELELDSFAETLPMMYTNWLDKRVLEHRYEKAINILSLSLSLFFSRSFVYYWIS